MIWLSFWFGLEVVGRGYKDEDAPFDRTSEEWNERDSDGVDGEIVESVWKMKPLSRVS